MKIQLFMFDSLYITLLGVQQYDHQTMVRRSDFDKIFECFIYLTANLYLFILCENKIMMYYVLQIWKQIGQ